MVNKIYEYVSWCYWIMGVLSVILLVFNKTFLDLGLFALLFFNLAEHNSLKQILREYNEVELKNGY